MSKVKSSKVPHYELLYIISNKFSEEELSPVKEKVEQTILANGGEINYQHDWGKKKLSYRINGFKHGYYILMEFDLPGENLTKINNYLRLSSDILRHMIIKRDKRSEAELKKEKEEREAVKEEIKLAETITRKPKEEKVEKEKEVKVKKENKTEIEEKETTKTKEKITTKKKEVKKDLEIEDLDDKLDKILDTSSLI